MDVSANQPDASTSACCAPRNRAAALFWCVLRFAAIVALYVAAGRLGRRIDSLAENTRVLYPQSGVALAGLVLFGVRYWPAVTLASLLVTQFGQSMVGPGLAAGFALGNTLAAVAAALVLRHAGRFRPSLSRVSDVLLLIAAGVVFAPLITAGIAVATFWYSSPDLRSLAFELFWRRWFGHGMGNLVVAPVLMTWGWALGAASMPLTIGQQPDVAVFVPREDARASGAAARGRRWLGTTWTFVRAGELALLLLMLVVVCVGAFLSRTGIAALNYPLSYAPFPFAIWAALRFGARGASTATLLIAAIAIHGTSRAQGPFAPFASGEELLLLQVYLMVVALSALFLAAAVSQHRAAERDLSDSREQLRALSSRLQIAREEERTIVAREIHDELGQLLTGMKMGLNFLGRKLPPDPPVLGDKVRSLTGLADEAVQTVRRIARDLRPGILDDLGLVESMQWQLQEFQQRMGIETAFSTDVGELAIDADRSTALFRILQESLTNVARHSGAARVQVSLRMVDRGVVLEVADNGRGIAGDPFANIKSLGLVGMRERAILAGGTLDIVPGADGGTVVRAAIPLGTARE